MTAFSFNPVTAILLIPLRCGDGLCGFAELPPDGTFEHRGDSVQLSWPPYHCFLSTGQRRVPMCWLTISISFS